MSSRLLAMPLGFIAPCLPTRTARPPAGDQWWHEIKHDGFRVIARKHGKSVRLYSRPGNDLTKRFPLIVDALTRLRASSCIIDGEAVACGDDGIPSFERLRYKRHDASVMLFAFDLIACDGEDLRRESLASRKTALAKMLERAAGGIKFTERLIGLDGAIVFEHACKLGNTGQRCRVNVPERSAERRRTRWTIERFG